MKVRAFATVCLIAVGGFLGGCAGTPDGDTRNWDASNRPEMLMPGAVRSDVKGLAMGAARSKGWTIVKSSDDLLVMQRPLDPASPSAASVGAASSVIPPMIEVTSAFIEQADGVKVALGAEAITQAPGEKLPKAYRLHRDLSGSPESIAGVPAGQLDRQSPTTRNRGSALTRAIGRRSASGLPDCQQRPTGPHLGRRGRCRRARPKVTRHRAGARPGARFIAALGGCAGAEAGASRNPA